MATCRQAITPALRKARVVTEGRPVPSEYDFSTALVSLSSLYMQAVTGGLLGRLTSIDIDADYVAKEMQRIRPGIDVTADITLPDTIVDTDTGETRAPKPNAVVLIVQEPPRLEIYSHVIGRWVTASDLTLDSYAPFSEYGLDGLACWLAVRLFADGYGLEPEALTVRQAGSFRSALATRFDALRTEVAPDFF